MSKRCEGKVLDKKTNRKRRCKKKVAAGNSKYCEIHSAGKKKETERERDFRFGRYDHH